MAEVQLTKDGYLEKQKRLEYLKTVERANVAEEIKIARGFGDLSENAEYDAARKRQAEVEGEIVELEASLRLAKIISATTVKFCEIKNGKEGEVKEYKIVGTAEADISKNYISDESPIGSRIVNAKKDEIVEINLPNGRTKTLKIISTTK